MELAISPEMQEHIDRWRFIESCTKWLMNIEEMKDFALKRPGFQSNQLNSFFNLRGERQIIIKK